MKNIDVVIAALRELVSSFTNNSWHHYSIKFGQSGELSIYIHNLQCSIYHSVYVHYIIVFQDMKRLKAHELLEKETIKASALRHKLANLPHKVKAELAGLYMYALSNQFKKCK